VIILKLLFTLLGLPLALTAVMPAASAPVASAAPAATDLSLTEQVAIIQTVAQAAAARLKLGHDALRLAPGQTKRSGDWVFLKARMRNIAGQPFNYAGTGLYQAAQAGAVSDECGALLHRENGVWKLVDIAVGPTDVAWENWPAKHQAPADVFIK
jgi:hypothetical protein